ncbi:anti-phage-associated DUF1156 domain-containing protein [Butyrivibrio sp. VCB2006]|uniref:anti-phage-associated DUF1156 domain-containing protein n=1 Tax=Butyrivibrio sp. VCB2006 TaxID=1280679 RepID=UPI000402B635|nr:anti-phage-associated DUF1156 domain-containing protein [Butyrivibrio sp. VCB2006]
MSEGKSFIEVQFPVSKVSKESFKERKAVQSQTLTGLGKWWGRKPLILVRAAILGCLLPATDNPKKDMEIFQKLLMIDNESLWERSQKSLSSQELFEICKNNSNLVMNIDNWFEEVKGKVKLSEHIDKEQVEKLIFSNLGYDEKLKFCLRPEEMNVISAETWNDINGYCGTTAKSLEEFVEQMSIKRYGHKIIVGDCFAGGGSIPFEASRIGADVFASDLNPVAGLLTWADLSFSLLSKKDQIGLKNFQKRVYDELDSQIEEMGFESAENGDRGDAYLYCTEATCPECGMRVPLAPNWLIGQGSKTVAILEKEDKHIRIRIKMNASADELKRAKSSGTLSGNAMVCPACGKETPISSIRHDGVDKNGNPSYGLRCWEKEEFINRDDDLLGERLYAIRYNDPSGKRYYKEPDKHDLDNERFIIDYLRKNISYWQAEGIIPSAAIENGVETTRLEREKGWKYWHQLFNYRQLILHGLMHENIIRLAKTKEERIYGLLCLHRCCNWNSKLCSWGVGQARESMAQTFYNQAFNTMWNYGARGLSLLEGVFFLSIDRLPSDVRSTCEVQIKDARDIDHICDYWITDPPYADAVNYHELTEFFLAWDRRIVTETFPDWYVDSKRVLAVKGDDSFSNTMIGIYSNLASHMSCEGMQIVMFTHSDPAVWAQLAIIMWKAGLKVTAAWNIATETDAAGIKKGNYVKGTVLLVLRKQSNNGMAFLDEINADIRNEVKNQIESMQQLDDKEEPNFTDPDYVLAAYAASLKVLTAYAEIEDLDLDYELNQAIKNPAGSKVVTIIENAKKIAYDCVIPAEFDGYLWRDLTNAEKFFIKGLESEKQGDYSISTYQEYARGFSIGGYSQLMASEKANTARLKTPFEMASRSMSDVPDFESSLMRTIFLGIYVAIKEDMNPSQGLNYIKNDLPNYWEKREMIQHILGFLVNIKDISNMQPHWTDSAEIAEQLLALVTHDSI